MASFLQQLGEARPGAFGEPLATAVPRSDQMSHRFAGRYRRGPRGPIPQPFKRFAHNFGLTAASLARALFEKSRDTGIDSDI
jgi:hypothetical protein